jgi:hypothetical protein
VARPSPISVYFVGAALLGIFAAAAWALSGDGSGRTVSRLTIAAKHCGFEDPRFKHKDGVFELNETEVTGQPHGPLSPGQQRSWDRSQSMKAKRMPCLQDAAKAIGVRVNYEQMVIVN